MLLLERVGGVDDYSLRSAVPAAERSSTRVFGRFVFLCSSGIGGPCGLRIQFRFST